MHRYWLKTNRTMCKILAVGLLGLLCFQQTAFSAEEKMVWDICKKIEANPEDLSEVIADCEKFMNGRQTDQLAPVVKSVLAWCYFKTGKLQDGVNLLMALEKKRYTPMQKAGSDVAKAWLSRVDIKLTQAALQLYYRKHMKYPEDLQDALDYALNSKYKLKAPSTDRWGKKWEYELVGFKKLIKVPKNQKYTISSVLLGQTTDFNQALELPYAEKIKLLPVRMASTVRGKEAVYFVSADDKKKTSININVGGRRMGVTVGFVGKNVIALTEGNHWKMVSRPKR